MYPSKEHLRNNMFFSRKPCAVCAEKDKRIEELREQVAYLKTLTIPENNPALLPLVTREADAVISSSQEIINVPVEQKEEYEKYMREREDAMSERDRILSGQY